MLATTHKTHYEQFTAFRGVMMLSAWGFALVVASFLFLWVGYKLDEMLGTAPNFMLGLFLLAIFVCVTRLYQEARKRLTDV
jgi:F0F1-type ATP synthase assembly protein I